MTRTLHSKRTPRSLRDTPSLVVVNIGNTYTTIALYRQARISTRMRCPTGLPSAQVHAALNRWKTRRHVAGAALCSVVPALVPVWRRRLCDLIDAPLHILGPNSPLGVRMEVPNPAQVGPDRLANAAAAFACFGAPTIVVDAGTATTFSVVARGGRFLGGAIAPGPALFSSYLAERTARLPEIGLRGKPAPIGRTTVSAMHIGLHIGYAGMVRAILAHLRHVPGLTGASVVVTGGAGRLAAGAIGPEAIHDRDLTLIGIGLVAARALSS